MDENNNAGVPENVQAPLDSPVQQPAPAVSQSSNGSTQAKSEPQTPSEPEVQAGGQDTATMRPKSSNKMLLIGLIFLVIAVIVGGGYVYLQSQKQNSETSVPTPTLSQESPSPTPDPNTNPVDEFVCPEPGTLDCTPCTEGVCPSFDPAYCSKGSAYYNFIMENCPDVEIVGIE